MQLRDFLVSKFAADRCGDLDAIIELRWDAGSIVFEISRGALNLNPSGQAILTLYFDTEERIRNLMQGVQALPDAFVRGQLRSSGYIVWVFQTLAAFSGNGDALPGMENEDYRK